MCCWPLLDSTLVVPGEQLEFSPLWILDDAEPDPVSVESAVHPEEAVASVNPDLSGCRSHQGSWV